MTKILLVEDDNNLREIYEARLQAEGYSIVSARDGEEALVVAKAEKPDLIISDIMMPKISGFEMLDILRNTDDLRAVKIIMLTALGQSDDQQRADKLGADRYLVKSQVTLEDIVRVAHELLSDAGGAPTTGAPAAGTDQSQPQPAVAEPSASPVPQPEPVAVTEPKPVAAPASDTSAVNGVLRDNPTNSPAPIPEPVTAPEPASPPAPATDDNSTKTSDNAATTAQEEAKVEAKIEDFIAGAEEQPNVATAPVQTEPSPTPEPHENAAEGTESSLPADPIPAASATVSENVNSGEPEDQVSGAPSLTPSEAAAKELGTDQAEENDAQLVDNAVKTLEESTQEAAGSDEVIEAPAPSDDSKKGGERVIQPLDSEPKTDINDLLALEEAKEVESQPVPTIDPIIVDDKKGQVEPAPAASGSSPSADIGPAKISPRPQTQPGQVDPNSIAL